MLRRTARRRSAGLAALAFILVVVVWQVPDLSALLYPFRFFVTTVHELGHGLAALATGGRFVGYQVYASGAGVATTTGGLSHVVIPAGYVGTALFGAALLYLTNRTPYTRTIAVLLGIGFAALTVLFARSLTAILVGLLSAAALVLLGWKAPILLAAFALNFLAILTGLHAVLDLWGLLHSLDSAVLAGTNGVPNDAYNMAQAVPLLPPVGWAVLWIVLALALLALAAYYTFWFPFRRRAL